MVATSTHFVIDESGSMRDIEDGVYEGVQRMLTELPNDSYVTFSRFNEVVTVGERQVCGEAAGFSRTRCAGKTALYDAILAAIVEEEKDPIANTHIVVITDGQDNASCGTAEDVRATVNRVRVERAWTVSFMGCNQDAVLTAKTLLGVEEKHALTYDASASGVKAAFRALSANISEFAADGQVGGFTQVQRQASLPLRFGDETAAFLEPPKLCRQKSCMDGI